MIKPKYEGQLKPSKADEADAYELVTMRDWNTCGFHLWDECQGAVQRDHRQNRRPGNTVVSNLQLLCMVHHKWKTEHPKKAIAEGWAVPSYPAAVPSEWPARRCVRTMYGTRRQAWVLYSDDGGVREITEVEARERMVSMGWRADDAA